MSEGENSRVDNEANVKSNAVQNRLLSEEADEEERQPSHRPKNSETEVKSRQASFLRQIVTNMDLDLLRDNRYIAIVLGRLRTTQLHRSCRSRILIIRIMRDELQRI